MVASTAGTSGGITKGEFLNKRKVYSKKGKAGSQTKVEGEQKKYRGGRQGLYAEETGHNTHSKRQKTSGRSEVDWEWWVQLMVSARIYMSHLRIPEGQIGRTQL